MQSHPWVCTAHVESVRRTGPAQLSGLGDREVDGRSDPWSIGSGLLGTELCAPAAASGAPVRLTFTPLSSSGSLCGPIHGLTGPRGTSEHPRIYAIVVPGS